MDTFGGSICRPECFCEDIITATLPTITSTTTITVKPTDESTVEPTIEPRVEPTVEPTDEPITTTTTTTTTTSTTTTSTTTTLMDQVCSVDQKCVCFRPVVEVESEGFDFEWHNFLYGGLAGVGAIVLVVVVYQLVCFKEKKGKRGYDIGMSDYVSDDVA